jgi:hypothetical protein
MPFSSGDLVQWGGNCDDTLHPHVFLEWVNTKTGVCYILDTVKGEKNLVYSAQLKKVDG